jgi:hypothetical protein
MRRLGERGLAPGKQWVHRHHSVGDVDEHHVPACHELASHGVELRIEAILRECFALQSRPAHGATRQRQQCARVTEFGDDVFLDRIEGQGASPGAEGPAFERPWNLPDAVDRISFGRPANRMPRSRCQCERVVGVDQYASCRSAIPEGVGTDVTERRT